MLFSEHHQKAVEAEFNRDEKFRAWLKAFDAICIAQLGMGYKHFPDQNHRDSFDGGSSPEDWFDECKDNWDI